MKLFIHKLISKYSPTTSGQNITGHKICYAAAAAAAALICGFQCEHTKFLSPDSIDRCTTHLNHIYHISPTCHPYI